MKVQIVQLSNEYIKNLLNGRYFLARQNMLANQLNDDKIEEKIDGCLKSKEYMKAECALMKMQAIMSFRNASFGKEQLKKYGCSEKEIADAEKDYYEGKIIREVYDEVYKKGHKAKFVKDSV